MNIYFFPIKTAFITFPLIAIALTLPYLIIQYHKYGAISKLKSFIVLSFFLYLLCAYYLVVLPLPHPDAIPTRASYTQLVPFNFISDFFKESKLVLSNYHTYLPALKQGVVLQPLFNIFLTIPFGLYLATFYHKSLKKVILFTFFLSLFFELTQLSGVYGLYPHPYRLFDVDDLMLNTLGGIMGYGLGGLFKFVPNKNILDENSIKHSKNVSYSRRIIAFIIDLLIIRISQIIIVIIIGLLSRNNDLSNYVNIIFYIIFGLYFIVLHALFNNTIGKKIVNIKLIKTDFSSLLIRYLIILLVLPSFGMINIVSNYFNIPFIYIIVLALIVINMIINFPKAKHLFYENLNNNYNVSTLVIK
ncbi:MAG: VanZ family protein [Bacilli bacterium]|jgi:glycopeptide antibiotics resistance protein|nr:VanZ family protein [Bacilli bacterium]